jgi:hypothetical protein
MSVCLYSSLNYVACKSHILCIILYCHVLPLSLCHIFPHYLTNGTVFGKKVIEYKMCVLIFSTTFVWNLYHSKKNSVKYYLLFLSGFNKTWIFLTDFQKILRYQSSWKSVPWELSFCMWTDRQTDGESDRCDNANSRFLQFLQTFLKMDWGKTIRFKF